MRDDFCCTECYPPTIYIVGVYTEELQWFDQTEVDAWNELEALDIARDIFAENNISYEKIEILDWWN